MEKALRPIYNYHRYTHGTCRPPYISNYSCLVAGQYGHSVWSSCHRPNCIPRSTDLAIPGTTSSQTRKSRLEVRWLAASKHVSGLQVQLRYDACCLEASMLYRAAGEFSSMLQTCLTNATLLGWINFIWPIVMQKVGPGSKGLSYPTRQRVLVRVLPRSRRRSSL
jgi:hypothetical protein